MLRIFNNTAALVFVAVLGACALNVSGARADVATSKIHFVKPWPEIFDHKKHMEQFGKLGVSCTDCHSFSVKPGIQDPLSPPVGKGHLVPSRKICHECHLGKVTVPLSNQCTLCHTNTHDLMPQNHHVDWKTRHGTFAQMDRDSCRECHTDKSCSQCHTQRDIVKPQVHRPNFRSSHSIEARANPQKCVTCHTTVNSCVQCHTRGTK